MSQTGKKEAPPRPVAGDAMGSDWFYDELMTAQPDATREYFRARLLRPVEPARPQKREG